MNLVQITDLHLSDRHDTPAADALRWAIDAAHGLAPDLVAFTGDMTTWGSAASARRFVSEAGRLTVPWVFTPGNAELRTQGADGAMAVLASHVARQVDAGGVRFVLPDTSTGRLVDADRAWLSALPAGGPTALLTHYPLDTLDDDSRRWLEAWLAGHRVELYLAGHRHFSRSRQLGGCLEVITQGLDPDKAFDGPPGIDRFTRSADGAWSQTAIPWPHGRDLLPAEIDTSPVGWSIHGDPLAAVGDTLDAGLHVLELRPHRPDYDLPATVAAVARLRAARPLYLSWHLPSLSWDARAGAVTGGDAVAAQVEAGRACGVDAFTVHVPQIDAAAMDAGGAPGAAWDAFIERFDALFRGAVDAGVRLSIENIHNAPGTPRHGGGRKFATEIGEYLAWIDAVRRRLGGDPGRIGAHLDVGHARNNGDLGNAQPLGDWYVRVGRHVTGYHIHQVRPHETTGKLTNHRDIRSVYDRTISYAGFLHAWSRRTLRRAPLFVEVRHAGERRRTVDLLRTWFATKEEG